MNEHVWYDDEKNILIVGPHSDKSFAGFFALGFGFIYLGEL